jgi:hypothetical protein
MPGEPGPRYWRDLAKEARAKANTTTNPRSNSVLLGLASSYERLAKRLGRRLRDMKKSK